VASNLGGDTKLHLSVQTGYMGSHQRATGNQNRLMRNNASQSSGKDCKLMYRIFY